MSAVRDLVAVLRDPARALELDGARWTRLLSVARAEVLDGTLAHRCVGLALPAPIAAMLADIRAASETATRRAIWEAEMARRALAPLGVSVILLKGTAYAAAGLDPAPGRQIGDLDILVPRDRIDAVEAALLGHGWEWVKQDDYDDAYYRRWMHELPPLVHSERDRMIDVHHTILPLTARPMPNAAAMIADAVPAGNNGLMMLSREDMVCHAAAHLFADGDLAGGLRNLWDIDRLCRQFSADTKDFYLSLYEEAHFHGLLPQVLLALRLSMKLFDTPVKFYRVPIGVFHRPRTSDRLFIRRLLARNDWGGEARAFTRFAFYVRSHLLRMPLRQLLPHLATKWRKRSVGGAG